MKRKILIAVLSAIAASALCGFVLSGCAKNAHINGEQQPADLPATEQGSETVLPPHEDAETETVLPPHEDAATASGCSHEYSAWTVGFAPTCTSIGYDVRTCEKCGDVDYRFLDAKGHAPKQVNYNQSIHIYECKTCGELVTAEHDFDENDTCTFCNYVADYTLGLIYDLTNNQSYCVWGIYGNFENLIIPSTYKGLPVTEIHNQGFYGCPNLKSVVIPDSVTKIGNKAFFNCSNLTDVTFPKFLEEIGELAFAKCDGLKEITLPENLTTVGAGLFLGCKSLTKVNIPKDWTEIPHSMYVSCTGLENIEIPDHITSIGNTVFANCTALKSVKFGDNVTYIGNNAFRNCTALESIELPENLLEIDNYAFYYCTSLKSVILNKNLTTIKSLAFNFCTALESIEFSESVTHIGNSAFSSCTALKSIKFGESVTYIGNSAFNNTALESVELPASLLEIGSNVFSGMFIKKIVLKEGSTVFGGFGGCETLVEVVLPESITLVCKYALTDCDGLTRITYNGTMAQWKAVEKQSGWKSPDNIITNFFVDCTDGTLEYIW